MLSEHHQGPVLFVKANMGGMNDTKGSGTQSQIPPTRSEGAQGQT